MFTSTIKWGEGTRTLTHESAASLVAWLTNLYDATGQRPQVFNAEGNLVAIGYNERGRAYFA